MPVTNENKYVRKEKEDSSLLRLEYIVTAILKLITVLFSAGSATST